MALALGIDLGTRTSCVYLVRDGSPELLEFLEGEATFPSVLAFPTDEEVRVGFEGARQAIVHPSRTVHRSLRLLGRKFYSAHVDWLRESCAYEVVPATNGDVRVRIGPRDVSPEELQAYLLRHIRTKAEEFAGEPVTDAVIVSRAVGDTNHRRGLGVAAMLAGFNRTRLLDSTCAHLLAQNVDCPLGRSVAVIDIGDGGFHVTIAQRGPRSWIPRATAGDSLLGGADLEKRVMDHMIDAFHAEHGVDLAELPGALQRLHQLASRTINQIGQSGTSFGVEFPGIVERDGESLDLQLPPLTAEEFMQLTEAELDNFRRPCAWALEDARIGTEDLHGVLITGGAAEMALVREKIGYLFGRPVTHLADPFTAPALGAAIYASGSPKARIRQLNGQSVCVKVRGGNNAAMIERNAALPNKGGKTFALVSRKQPQIVFEIYEGESELAVDNLYLGRLVLRDVKPGVRPRLEVVLDASGWLKVLARDQAGKVLPSVFERSGGIAGPDVAALRDGLYPETEEAEDEIDFEPAMPSVITQISDISLPGAPDGWGVDEDAPTRAVEVQRVRPSRPNRPSQVVAPPVDSSPVIRAQTYLGSEDDLDGPTSDSEPPGDFEGDALVGTVVGGRYFIERIVAEGGMGRVYLARHNILNKRFAVKVLHPELASNASLADRFLREAQSAASIDSDHVVEILDFGRLDDGTGYFVMEFLDGKTLADVMHEGGALDPKLIQEVAIQVANGLAAAHDMKIVHRDLKPENITIVERHGKKNFAKILDFGIAKRPTSSGRAQLTMVGTMVGTPHYMAPEQITGINVTGRADIYALGIVMYEMATGVLPFDSESVALLLAMQKNDTPRPIQAHRASRRFPKGLSDVIFKCLEKPQDKRPKDARELAKMLENAL